MTLPKRKKRTSPTALPLEIIQWYDNAAATGEDGREFLDVATVEFHTVGLLIHEDEKQVVLAHEVEANDDYMNQRMQYTQIWKVNILSRTRLQEGVALYAEGGVRERITSESR